MPGVPPLDFRVVLGLKLAVAAFATALLLWDWRVNRRGRTGSTSTRWAIALAFTGAAALAGWWNFGQFHPGGLTVHYHEFFHYYLGSKYFPELGYTGLYDCVAAADAEQGLASQAASRWIRDLETNQLRIGSPAVFNPALCRSRFSAPRWAAFTHDVGWFRDRVSARKWADMGGDHGYNATPVWNAAGYVLSNTGPATATQIRLLSLIDPLLLMFMWAMVCWAFGWRVACVAAVWWGTNYPARYTYIGGAFLREDWLVLAVAAICLARRGRALLAGFALGWSALLRIFPGFVLGAVLAKVLVASYRARRVQLTPAELRIAAGATLAVLLLLPVSVSVGVGTAADPSVWSAFARNSRKHLSTPLTNNVGLPMLLSFEPSTRASRISGYWMDAPWDLWMSARVRVFDERFPIYLACATGFLVALFAAVRDREEWVVLVLGVGLIPVLTNLTGYYYGVLLVFAFLWPQQRLVGLALAMLATITCLTPVVVAADDDRYMLLSAAVLLFVSFTTLVYTRWYRPVSVAGSPDARVPAH